MMMMTMMTMTTTMMMNKMGNGNDKGILVAVRYQSIFYIGITWYLAKLEEKLQTQRGSQKDLQM